MGRTSSLVKYLPYLSLDGVLTAYSASSRPAGSLCASASRSLIVVSGLASERTNPAGALSRRACTRIVRGMGVAAASDKRETRTPILSMLLCAGAGGVDGRKGGCVCVDGPHVQVQSTYRADRHMV